MNQQTAHSTPMHLRIVGGIALLWSLLGAVDFALLRTNNDWYRSQFTAEQLAFGDAYPGWLVAVWATALVAGIGGAALLLLRRGLSMVALGVAFVSMMIVTLRNYSLDGKVDIGVLIFIALMASLVYYVAQLRSKGVLR